MFLRAYFVSELRPYVSVYVCRCHLYESYRQRLPAAVTLYGPAKKIEAEKIK